MQRDNVDLGRHVEHTPRVQRRQPGQARLSLNPGASRSDDWVEISSQPSSSSLSSATDEIIPTGLRVPHDSNARRRRRLRTAASTQPETQKRSTSAGGSSQEEYEESESESDRMMTSSNEGPRLLLPLHKQSVASVPRSTTSEDVAYEKDDEDERSTALGVVTNEQCFIPQPNAFSHPPVSQSGREDPGATSYFPASTPNHRTAAARRSDPGQLHGRQHTPYNMVSPSYQAENDLALRASLSTLLSLGAAARGLPKSTGASTTRPAPASRVDPATIRMVPESALPRSSAATKAKPALARRPSTQSSESDSNATPASANTDKGKRKAVARSSSKDRRSAKKIRRMSSSDETVSPTLLTWVVSAGVVVLVSAISFSAGYAIGKEAGKAEAGIFGGSDGSSCGKEVVKGGFRRLRWAAASTAVTV